MIYFIFIFLSLFSYNAFSQSKQVNQLIEIALEKSPQIVAVKKNIDISKARALQMNSLDPVSIGIEFYQIPVSSINVFQTMEYDYFIQQMFPFPGKISSKVEAEEKGVEMSGEEGEYIKRKIINEIKQIYYEIYMLQQKLDILKGSLIFMKEVISTTSFLYSVGKSSQEDIVKSEIEYAKSLQDSISIETETKKMNLMLNQILNRDFNSIVNKIDDFELSNLEPDFDSKVNDFAKNRPDLLAMKLNIEMSRLESLAAQKEYLPDFMVRLMYKKMGMDLPNFWSLMISTTLPFLPWSKPMIEYKVQEKNAKTELFESNYETMQNMAKTEVHSSIIKIKETKEKILLYQNKILPMAEINLKSNLVSYSNGKTNFLMVLDSHRMLQMFKMDYFMLRAEYEKSIANFEFATGGKNN